jgi:hypothetical protein
MLTLAHKHDITAILFDICFRSCPTRLPAESLDGVEL